MTQSIPIESLQQTFAAQTLRHRQQVFIWQNYFFPFVDISFRHLIIITRIFTTAMMASWPGKDCCKPEQAKGDIFKSHHQVTLTFGVLAGVLAACCIVYRDLEKDCKSKSCKLGGAFQRVSTKPPLNFATCIVTWKNTPRAASKGEHFRESPSSYLSRLLFAFDPHLLF